MKANIQGLGLWAILLTVVLQSCNVTLPVKDGATAFELKKYVLAADLLQEDYEKAKDKKEKHLIASQIAESYLAFSQSKKAEFWLKRAVDMDVDPQSMFQYAMVLKQNEKYTDAIQMLNAFYQYDRSQRLVVEGHVEACEEILEAMEAETYATITNLQDLNTSYSEFGPAMHEGMLVYSTNSKSGEEAKTDEWTGSGFANVKRATPLSNHQFQPDNSWEAEFNTTYHEATLVYSPDESEMYFTRCGMDDDNKDVCKIFWAYKEFDEWSPPIQLKLFGDSINVGHPFISPDGKQLYFSSDETFGYGGKDLYVSNKVAGEWTAPVNLGPRINTSGDELFPSIGPDSKLYFSSTGHYGYGGLDIFSAERRGRIFTNVQSLGYPINTGADDFSTYMITSEDDSVEVTGYMASNRKGGKGSDDLYFFEQRLTPAIKLPPPVFILKGIVEEKIFEDPRNPGSTVTGKQPLDNVSIGITDNTDPTRPYLNETLNTNTSGTFESYLDEDVDYLLNFTKNGYFANKEAISTRNMDAEDGDTILIERTIMMDKIYKEVEFTINNIYYDLDSANIRSDAALVLDSLSTILSENPGLRVELGSHTDSRGSDQYNLDLSQRRAESAVSYLISSGISTGRLIAKGYGETRLVNECSNGVNCIEEKHQENRRTTFKVIGLDFKLRSFDE